MKRFFATYAVGALLLILSSNANAALVAHYTFDTDGTASAGTDAILGAAASIDLTDSAVGAGSLALSAAPGTDTAGDDGAVSGNSFDWSASDTRTVAFWMKGAAGDHGDPLSTLISLGSTTTGGERFDIRLDGDALRLEVQAGGFTTASTIADGLWHHIAVVVDSEPSLVSDVDYFIDGVLIGSFSHGQSINTSIGPLRIGDSYQDVTRDFKGNIDDVRLYDHALNATEIDALATAIPEPATLALCGLALLGITVSRRR